MFRKLSVLLNWKSTAQSQSQDRESQALLEYSKRFNTDKSFIEFGFSPAEFNCCGLVKANYKGLLIDGSTRNASAMNFIAKLNGFKNTSAKSHYLTVDNLSPITDFIKENDGKLGVLSVDIDGNDYWILNKILESSTPDIIITEFNASLRKSNLTVKYKETFDRLAFHDSGWYHGASIGAFISLLDKKDYALVENISGLNLVFIKKELLDNDTVVLDIETGYLEHDTRNKNTNTDAEHQWQTIKHLDFEEVS